MLKKSIEKRQQLRQQLRMQKNEQKVNKFEYISLIEYPSTGGTEVT